MTNNPMVSPMFDYNSFICMDRFIHDREQMKTLGDDHIHFYNVTPWATYIIISLLDCGTQRTSCFWLSLYCIL